MEITEKQEKERIIETGDSLNNIKTTKNDKVDTKNDKGLSPWKTIGICFLTYLIYGCLSSYVFHWKVNDISMYIGEVVCILLMLSYAGMQLTWREQNGKTLMSYIALMVAYGWALVFCVSIYKNLQGFFICMSS